MRVQPFVKVLFSLSVYMCDIGILASGSYGF